MAGKWYHLAKADFRVQTSRFGSKAKSILGLLFGIGIVWAFIAAPMLMTFLFHNVLGVTDQILILVMPGLMRAGLMLIWFVILLVPLSNSLKEIKIGQWEILLSNNVKTRDMLVGSFLAKLPVNGLLVLFAAPILLAPFVSALQVSLIGQILMYSEILIVTLSTIWLSNLISIAIQSKLGESPRGKDLANALAILLGLVVALPFVGLQLAANVVADILGWNIFLVMPFTWSADLLTGSAIIFNGVGYAIHMNTILSLDFAIVLLLQSVFIAVVLAIGISAADRLFTLGAGARMESVASSGRNNILLRGLRRAIPGSFGILLVTAMKDFGRKAQNISKVSIMLVMAVAFPLLLSIRGGYLPSEVDLQSILVMMGLAFAILGGTSFGGVGFLESEDQLWMIKTAPRGTRRFILARVTQAFLYILPIVLVSSTIVAIVFNLTILEVAFITPILLSASFGSALVGIGVSASNPTYEDTKSEAFKSNASRTMVITIVSFAFYMIADLCMGIMGFGALPELISASDFLYLTFTFAPLPIMGVLMVFRGSRSLSQRE
ncbi:MAG: hypothetical protein ACXAC0_05925 [Candidatus Thorarchaeota archaeon]|jgi:hypothetical protein